MQRNYGVLLVSLMSFAWLAGCGGAPAYVPAFAPQPGESYALSNDTTSIIAFSMAGQAQTMETREKSTWVITVRDADDFKKVLDVTVETLSLKMDDMGMPGVMLSSQERDQVLSKIIGKTFSIEVTHTGEVLSVDIDPAFTANIVKETGFTGPKRLQAEQLLDLVMGTDTIRRGMEGWLGVYTNEAKKPGDTWQSTKEIPFADSAIEATSSYTLDNLSESEATISVGTVLNGDMEQGPVQVTLSGSGSGNMHLLRGSGWPVDGESTMSLTGSAAGMPGQMNVNVQVRIRGEKR